MNKKVTEILYAVLSIGNVAITVILMDVIFGKGNPTPIWVEYFILIYIIAPMFYAYKLIVESFGKNN